MENPTLRDLPEETSSSSGGRADFFAALSDKLRDAEARARELAADRLRLEDLQMTTMSIMEDLEEARKEAERANRAKSEFLANLSHEIRSPMNGILGMLDLALQTGLTDDQRKYLETAKGAAEALCGILNDVLDLSKIEAGRLEIHREEFCLREVLEEVVALLAIRAHQKSLELFLDMDPKVPSFVCGDGLRLRQIALNLLGNAVKFTNEGEVSIAVALLRDDSRTVEIEISVADTGPGIPQEHLEEIFEPFRQVGRAAARGSQGTGLGLTISRKLAEAMGGKIWAESRLGRGTTFRCVLPFGRVDREEPALPRLDGLSALVVEDHASVRRILAGLLGERGARVQVARDAAEARSGLEGAGERGRGADVIIWDVDVPDCAGRSPLLSAPDLGIRTAARFVFLVAPAKGETLSWRLPDGSAPICLSKPVMEADLLRAVLSAAGAAPARTEEFPEVAAFDPRRLRVLVADDHATSRELAATFLRRRGYVVAEAEDGCEAFEKFRRQHFDLVLLDLRMPGMDGFEVARRIRALEAQSGKRVPILALTAYGLTEEREEFLRSFTDGYLTKPVRRRDLYRAIDDKLGPPRPFDDAALLERLAGDWSLLRRLLEAFKEEIPGSLAEIETSIRSRQGERLAHAAHGLRGSISNFCAGGLTRLLEKLESDGASGDFASAERSLEEIRRGLHELVAALEALAAGSHE